MNSVAISLMWMIFLPFFGVGSSQAVQPIRTVETIDCKEFKQQFDTYSKSSSPVITNDPKALCYGLNYSSDFASLAPKWGVGELVSIDGQDLTLKGLNETTVIRTGIGTTPANDYEVGKQYKVDMLNICRSSFMMVSSVYPSNIEPTFVAPEEVICKKELEVGIDM